ncbi:MAG: ATP-binding protein [Thermoleophilia bacterium]
MKKVKNIFVELTSVFNTRLGRRILVPLFLVLAFFTIPLFFVFRTEAINDETNAAVQHEDKMLELLYEIQGGMRQEQIAVYEMVYEKRQAAMDDFSSAFTRVSVSIEAARQTSNSTDEQLLLEKFQNDNQQIQGTVISGIEPIVKAGDSSTQLILENDLHQLFNQTVDIRTELAVLYGASEAQALSSQVEARKFASDALWASILLFVGLGLGVAALSTRRLVLPIKRATDASFKIASGDLSQRVEIKGNDELAAFGRSFNDMADSLERQTSQLVNEKARIRSIHQSIGDGIIVVDRGGVIVLVNPAAERALGITAKELERTTNTGIPALQRVFTRKIRGTEMVKCWEAKSCAKADCPSHGSPDHRCWLQCGTFCYNQIQGTFKQKRDACERCDVFLKNAIIQFEFDVNARRFSGQAVPTLDDFGQEEGKTIVLHDVTDLRRAKEDAEQSAAQLAVLNSVSRAAAGSLELDSILDASLASMIGGTMADAGFIHTGETGSAEMVLVAAQGIDDTFRDVLAKIPQGTGCPGHVVESGGSVLENNLDQLGAAAQAAVDAGFHSYVGAPLMVKKEILGVISLVAVEPHAFTIDDKHLLSMVGIRISMAMANANLFSQTIEFANQDQARSRIAATLASGFEFEANFEDFAQAMHGLVDFDRISVVIESSGNTKVIKEMDFDEQPELVEQGMKSQVNTPLIAKGKALGSLNLASIRKSAFDEDTVKRLQPIADQLALALDSQRLFEEVSRAKQEWETTFDSASEGIIMVSKDHRITRANRTAAAMLGGEVKDLLGRRCYEVVHKTSEAPAFCLMRQAHADSTTSSAEQENEDGSTLEIIVDAVHDEQGIFIGAVHFLRDITEARKLRQQLIQSEKMVAVGRLVAGVAHEINNPLTGVLGFAQLLQTRDIDDQARRDAESISREAERATRIVRHLLSFARKHLPERKAVDVNAVLRECIELKAYELRVNNILTEADLDAGIPLTLADPHQLQQVFLNLINNSEQALLADRGSGLLKISSQLIGDSIRVVFTDSGPGVPEELRDRIFEPFFTTKDVGKGTGLGLSVCYGIIEEHGGSISVEQSPDRGAVFVIELPLVAVAPPEEKQEETINRGRLGKILLVDDEDTIRQVLTETLRRAGHEVETARNGEVALRLLKQKHYDCVVSDVKMPGMDGPALHQAVRAIDPAAAGTFIFISGDTVSPETRSYLETVDNPTLAKPFEIDTLEQALQEMLAAVGEGSD